MILSGKMAKKQIAEDDKKRFIATIREHRLLWDVTDDNYKNARLKKDAWAAITQKFQLDDDKTAWKQWKNLRSSYRKAMNLRKAKAGSKLQKWVYQDQMSFLPNHLMHVDNTGSNFRNTEQDEAVDNDGLDVTLMADPAVNLSCTSNSTISLKREFNDTVGKYFRKKMRRSAHEPTPQPEPDDGGLKLFFDSAYGTVKKFPKVLQIQAKKQISDLLYDAEIRAENILIVDEEEFLHLKSGTEQD